MSVLSKGIINLWYNEDSRTLLASNLYQKDKHMTMTKDEVMQALQAFGNEQTRKIHQRHGATEPYFGVKVGDLKTLQRKIKKNQELALELFQTGNTDAMYLACLIADEKVVTATLLDQWMQDARWYLLSEYGVAGLAAESKYGLDMGLKWIHSATEQVAAGGWATLCGWVSIRPDQQLDTMLFLELLEITEDEIHYAPNRVRYAMNNFVIAVGSYFTALSDKAQQVAENIGKVQVNFGATSCKVPLASAYIEKVIHKGRLGKKRRYARC